MCIRVGTILKSSNSSQFVGETGSFETSTHPSVHDAAAVAKVGNLRR